MNNIWITSDTHFGHEGILDFINYEGDSVRPEFSDVFEMDEILIQNWNKVVKPNDKIYHLGDIGFSSWERCETILKRLNGKKRLILGNHDKNYDLRNLLKYFEKIQTSWRPSREIIFSHHPLHIGKDDPKLKLNVHGHVHRLRNQLSEAHLNVSTEMTDYTPIHIEEVFKKIGYKANAI